MLSIRKRANPSRALARMAVLICARIWGANQRKRSPSISLVQESFTETRSLSAGEIRRHFPRRRETFAHSMCVRESYAGRFTPSRIPENLVTTPGLPMPGKPAEPQTIGLECRLMLLAELFMYLPVQ